MAYIPPAGWFLRFVFGVCLAGGFPSFSSVGAAERPNILYILTDDQSYRTVGCYKPDGAYSWAKTPNLDRLASRGVRFTHAYLGSWCLPSRFTALSGRHPYAIESIRHGLIYPRNSYDPDRLTFWPQIFRANGYYTGMIGKWHTGKDAGFGRDWDYQAVWNRPAGSRANASAYYTAQEIHFQGSKKPVKVEGYPADHYTDWAVDFIKNREKAGGKPWALWLCYPNAHPPFTPASSNQSEYEDVHVQPPADILAAAPGKPGYVQKLHTWTANSEGEPVMKRVRTPTAGGVGLKGDTLTDWVRQYQQCVSAIDEGVGEVLAALAATGQEKNTLVIFTSDQGFAMGEHGFAHKLAPYDANLRAPLIVSQPGTLPGGMVCRTPVAGVDLVATIYAQAGVKASTPLDGHDVTPLLLNPASRSWNHPVVQSYTRKAFGEKTGQVWRSRCLIGPPVPWWTSVVDGHYKYIRTMVRGEVEELYDLRNDPNELVNLALREESEPLLEKMRASLQRELKRTGAPFADRMPATGTEVAKAKASGKKPVKATFAANRPSLRGLHPKREPEPREKHPQSERPAARPGKRASLGWKS